MRPRPLDDIRALLADLPEPDLGARRGVLETGSPNGLSAAAAWIAEWRGRPVLNRPIIALYAGAHTGLDDLDDMRARMEAIAAGDAPISRAAGHLGAGLDVFDLAIDRPVGDPALGPTMSERECAATMAFGMEALAKQPDLLVLGALGRGAGIAAAALAAALSNAADADPLDVLRSLGGRETAAIAGAIVAARVQRVPVLLEGYPAAAAAAVLHAIDAASIEHCRAGGAVEPGALAVLAAMGLSPISDPKLEINDGTGSTVALAMLKLACALQRGEMA